MKVILSQTLSAILSIAVVIFSSGLLFVQTAQAASLTTLSDTQTNQTASTLSSHDISFVTPTGLTTSQTIVLVFDNSTSVSATLASGDVALYVGGVSQTAVAGSNGASTWGFARTNSTTITITAPSSGTPASAGATVRIKYGSAAGGTDRITNGSAGTTTLTITAGSDSGTIVEPVIVNITATVAPTITFAISSNSIGFGTLSSSGTRYATTSGGSGTDATAHTLTVSTNAGSGYTLTYSGATLTDASSHTIPAATITSSATGTVGTSQFAISGTMTGSGTVASAYNHATPNWSFVAGTPTTLASASAPVSNDSVDMHYLANVSGSQTAGSYSTNITYVATGNF